MEIVLVVAMSENRVIGRDGDLPWRLSADLKHFKAVTMGHPVLMGRKTWDSIGRPLPGRRNIVISRRKDLRLEGAEVMPSIDAALTACHEAEAETVMVIGGGQIYQEVLPRAERIELTEVHTETDGDTHFPAIDPAAWEETKRERHPPETEGGPAFSFVTLQRR